MLHVKREKKKEKSQTTTGDNLIIVSYHVLF